MSDTAHALASWVAGLVPTADDEALAARSLVDTVAVTVAAAADPLAVPAAVLTEPGRWAALGHVLDFDDLHVESTAHVSVVCVPATLATGGDARAYLAGVGVMARIGMALGWPHYSAGWHATCTAGVYGAAAAASVGLGLDASRVAVALALAVPAAGGVQRAFGTQAKSLQVAFAVEAGVRAARLAANGAEADPRAFDTWLSLMGAAPVDVSPELATVPGGLAVKVHPCCYALQRPIAAIRALPTPVPAADVVGVRVRTPRAALQPLVHARPTTGLEGKFSLEYSVATALLDGFPDFESFTDGAVRRPEAQRLIAAVAVEATDGGDGLLDGTCAIELDLRDGSTVSTAVATPPGAPGAPLPSSDLAAKVKACAGDRADDVLAVTWHNAAGMLREL